MSLISRAHKQLQANKLKELLSSCPLVLVYQTLGNVRSSDLANGINDTVNKNQAPDAALRARSAKIKNTIAAAVKSTSLGSFFQADNVLIGWQLSSQHEQQAVSTVSRRSDTLEDQLGQLASLPSTSGQTTTLPSTQPPIMPHKSLARAIDFSLKLPSTMPVALLAGFYRGQHFRVSHLMEWMALDETKVYPELLTQIDSAADNLCGFESPLHQLLDTLDDMQPRDLLACLDARVDQPQQKEGDTSSASTAAAPSQP